MDVSSTEEQKFNELTNKLTYEFRQHALKFGWSLDVVSQMSVVWDDNGFGWDYPPTLEEQIDNLEYGAVGSGPAPAMLTFKNTKLPEILEGIADDYVTTLVEAGTFS